VDERIREHLAAEEISIGDFVLSGGELPALILIDAISRLLPGVLGDPDGAADDSFSSQLLEYPHYTRPPEFRGWQIPDTLISGNHAEINKWRRQQALLRTLQRRPDLLLKADLNKADKGFLEEILQTNKIEIPDEVRKKINQRGE
jgi:tRNA (guanine37-N1)-methyltransferase